MAVTFDPQRVISELKELRTLTSDEGGAQRVAFTPVWDRAREWLRRKMEQIGLTVAVDKGGNMWGTRAGRSKRALLIGGHIDSVYNAGWLDGALNLVAGLEVIRALGAEDVGEFTVKLVDWCDEEGARFGMSLFGSSAASGTINIERARSLKDRDGIRLVDAIAPYGLTLETMLECGVSLEDAEAYLELHIEQGPVLESQGLSLAAVLGTFGINRYRIVVTGVSAHSGTMPMKMRHDALVAAAKLTVAVKQIAIQRGGVGTVGRIDCQPGIPTGVPGEAVMLLDQRHLDPEALSAMLEDARRAAQQIADEEGVSHVWHPIMEMPVVPFHPELIDLADQAVSETCGKCFRMPSGALHDAAEVARRGVPTIMLFTQSLRGLSHNPAEDTREQDLVLSVEALYRLAKKTLGWMAARSA